MISNILQKCQYFSQQIFCYSLLPKVNLSYHAPCFRMTTTTLIKTHEIITNFVSGITFCSNGSRFYSKHTMAMKPILQLSLFQLKVFQISCGLFLPCLLAALRHAARHGHGTGEKVPTWALGGSAWKSPRSWAAHTNIPLFFKFFFKFVSSLLSLFSLLRFYFGRSTLPAVTIHPPGLLGWHLAITSLMHLFASSW